MYQETIREICPCGYDEAAFKIIIYGTEHKLCQNCVAELGKITIDGLL
jgi:hypothetical protein